MKKLTFSADSDFAAMSDKELNILIRYLEYHLGRLMDKSREEKEEVARKYFENHKIIVAIL